MEALKCPMSKRPIDDPINVLPKKKHIISNMNIHVKVISGEKTGNSCTIKVIS